MSDYEIQLSARQLGRLVDYYCITEILDHLLGFLETDFLMGLFTAPIEYGDLHFMARFQELADLAHLDSQVMIAYLQPEPHLFHIGRFGGLAVLLLLLGLLIVVLAPIDDLAHRRVGIGRYLYQVQVALAGRFQRLLTGQDAQLFPVFVDDAQPACPNLIVQAGIFCYWSFSFNRELIVPKVPSILTDDLSEVKRQPSGQGG